LVQLAHDFEGQELFGSTYGYRSGLNESMVNHLAALVTSIERRIALQPNDVVLDIGSNDGTLLSQYKGAGLRRIGIDPTISQFIQYYPPEITRMADFFSEATFRRVLPSGKARVVTSISMFYDLPDPNAFVRDIQSSLADDGLWMFEQSYLPTMVERNSFDTICHEHLEYYGLRQVDELVRRHGLRVFDVTLNEVNGGSFQVWACHREAPFASNEPAIGRLLRSETSAGYNDGTPVHELKVRVGAIRGQVLAFLEECRRKKLRVHGYGASTKGNTLLQYFGITPQHLPVIADRNPEKFGACTPGTNIPIIS
jgi:hypothetical protein